MTLFRKVDALPDDIVATILNLCDEVPFRDTDTIAYSHRIRAPYASQTEVSFHFTIKQLAIVCLDGVPAACVFYHKTLHIVQTTPP